LLVRSYDPQRQPAEVYRAYDAAGEPISGPLAPFARSLAGSVVSLEEPCAVEHLDQMAAAGTIELQPFERGRRSLLAAALTVAPGTHVVLELFDKEPGAFTPEDRRLISAAATFGTEMLRQALAERQNRQVLVDAVAAALAASDSLAQTLDGTADERREEPPPAAVLDRLREGLGGGAVEADDTLRLVEAVRVLALKHGPAAVQHCIHLVESLRQLLDDITGS
jgi:hypothetical protein